MRWKAPAAFGAVERVMDPIVEVFGTELPQTLAKYRVDLSFNPRFRDVLDEETIRLPLEFRYGLTDSTNLYTGIEPFIPNPINGGSDWGLSYARLGAKHQLTVNSDRVRLAVGLDGRYPLASPPYTPSDGYLRIEPYIAVERDLRWLDNGSVFLNVGYEVVEHVRGQVPDDWFVYNDDNLRITGGIIQYRGVWNPFFRAEYRFEIDDNPRQDSWFVEPGVLVDLPTRYTARLPGKWKVEAGLRYQVQDGDDKWRFNVRVRWRVTLRELGIEMGGKDRTSRP